MKTVDLSGPIYAQYKRARKRAEEAEKEGALNEAASAYRQSAALMRQYALITHDAKIRQQRQERAEALDGIADRLSHKHPPTTRQRASNGHTVQSAEAQAEDDYETMVLELIERTSVKWDDIGGLEETKREIKSAYGLALARKPQGVEISGWRNFLLYGPPGTGKTILAAATAGSLEATFFNVKVSSLLSKYFGETSKLISALYTVARRLEPSVIFLDEFESLTPPRGSGESGAERRIVSTFLAELDGLSSKDDPSFVLTIGATNVPWLLDTAILSRFQRRIYIPLPDLAARRAILEIHLTRRGHKTLVPIEELARRSNGFSGREIEQLCQTAITRMIQRLNPTLTALVDKGQEAVRNYEIHVEALADADFRTAFEQIHPITDGRMLRLYDEWSRKVQG